MARYARALYQRSNFINKHLNEGETTIGVGTVVVVGNRIGVAQGDILPGATGVIEFSGQWALPLKDGDEAAVGDYVYFDEANSYMTVTSNATYPVMVVSGYNMAAGEVAVDLAMYYTP